VDKQKRQASVKRCPPLLLFDLFNFRSFLTFNCEIEIMHNAETQRRVALQKPETLLNELLEIRGQLLAHQLAGNHQLDWGTAFTQISDVIETVGKVVYGS
jgi:hypothetical protein